MKYYREAYVKIGICVLAFLLILRIPFEIAFSTFVSEETSVYLKKIASSAIILPLAVYLIKKNNLNYFIGLSHPTYKYTYLYILPFYFIVLSGSSIKLNWSLDLVLIFIAVLASAFSEEFIFRGLVLPILLNVHNHSIAAIRQSLVLSSLVFGLSHFTSLINHEFISVLCQVIYATAIGLLFNTLLLKGHNIYLLGLSHGLLNFITRLNSISASSSQDIKTSSEPNFISVIVIIIILLPIIIVTIVLMRTLITKDISALIGQKDDSKEIFNKNYQEA